MVNNEPPIGERVAILETELLNLKENLKDITAKLDELLTLKAKGMGALGLVSLVIGSGVIGFIMMVISFFHRPQL